MPPERVLQLVEFAQFLEFRVSDRAEEWLLENSEEGQTSADEAEWQDLLSRPGARHVLREMADEAREDYRAGRTTDIGTTEDGRLRPE